MLVLSLVPGFVSLGTQVYNFSFQESINFTLMSFHQHPSLPLEIFLGKCFTHNINSIYRYSTNFPQLYFFLPFFGTSSSRQPILLKYLHFNILNQFFLANEKSSPPLSLIPLFISKKMLLILPTQRRMKTLIINHVLKKWCVSLHAFYYSHFISTFPACLVWIVFHIFFST